MGDSFVGHIQASQQEEALNKAKYSLSNASVQWGSGQSSAAQAFALAVDERIARRALELPSEPLVQDARSAANDGKAGISNLMYYPGVNDASLMTVAKEAGHYYLPALVGGAFLGMGGQEGASPFQPSRLAAITAFSQYPDGTRLFDGFTNGVRYAVEQFRPGGVSDPAKIGYLYEESLHALNGLTVGENVARYQRLIAENREDDAVIGYAMHGLVDSVSHVVLNGNNNPTFDELMSMKTHTPPFGHASEGEKPDFMSPRLAAHATTVLLKAFQTISGATNEQMGSISSSARDTVDYVIGQSGSTRGQEQEDGFVRFARKASVGDVLGLSPEFHKLPNPIGVFTNPIVNPITLQSTFDETASYLRGSDPFNYRAVNDKVVNSFMQRGIRAAIIIGNDYLSHVQNSKSIPKLNNDNYGLDVRPNGAKLNGNGKPGI